MTREPAVNFEALVVEQDTSEEVYSAPEGSWRRSSRHKANPTVQMSVRMPEETYERFRMVCLRERRTNGDMLAVMMEGYVRRGPSERPPREPLSAAEGLSGLLSVEDEQVVGEEPRAPSLFGLSGVYRQARLWLTAFRSDISRLVISSRQRHRQTKPL